MPPRNAIVDEITVTEEEPVQVPRDSRNPRNAEDYFDPALVAAAKAAWAQNRRGWQHPTRWEDLPVQTHDAWILIAHAAVAAWRESRGQE